MFKGYMAIGGVDGVGTTELFNAERTFAYASHVIPTLGLEIPESYQAPDLRWLLGYEDYGSPLSDQAVWTDPDDPASFEFLGFMPTEVTGTDSSTLSADTVEFVGDGGVAVQGRRSGREIRVKGLMVASSQDGMTSGMSWLRNVLSDTACRDGQDCRGERLVMLSGPPRKCDDVTWQVPPGRMHSCLAPFVRQFYRVQCTDGVTVRNEWSTPCGPLAEVEFLLYAGVPQPHRLPQFVGRAQDAALREADNLFPDPSFEDDATTYRWSGAEYESVSERFEYGALVQENLVTDPSFEGPSPFAQWDYYVLLNDSSTSHVVSASQSQAGAVGSWVDGAHCAGFVVLDTTNLDQVVMQVDVDVSGARPVRGMLDMSSAIAGNYYFALLAGPDAQSLRVLQTGNTFVGGSGSTHLETDWRTLQSDDAVVRMRLKSPYSAAAQYQDGDTFYVDRAAILAGGDDLSDGKSYFDGDSVSPRNSSYDVGGPFVEVSQDSSWSDTRTHSLRLDPVREEPRRRVSYVLNPSLESDASDWSVVSGGSGSVSTARAWRGSQSYAIAASGGVPVVVDVGVATVPQRYTALSLYVSTDATGVSEFAAQFDLLSGSTVVASTTQFTVAYSGVGWARLAVVFPVPSGTADTVRASVEPSSGAWSGGDTVWFDGVVLENGTTAGTYFDGAMADEPRISYSWRTEGGSVARYEGLLVSNRTYADLSSPGSLLFGAQPGREYYLSAVLHMEESQGSPVANVARTIQAVWVDEVGAEHLFVSGQAPNTPGDHEVWVRFVIPDSARGAFIRLYGGGGNVTWWDSLLLTGSDRTEYFDGSTTDSGGWTYAWLGEPDASDSRAEYNPVPPRTVPQQSCVDPDVTIIPRRNLFINPGPTIPQGWKKAGGSSDPYTTAFVSDDSRRVGGTSVEVAMTLDGGTPPMRTGWYLVDDVGDNDGLSGLLVDPDTTYTVSVYVKHEVSGKAHLNLGMQDVGGRLVQVAYSPDKQLTAGQWERLDLTFRTKPDAAFLFVNVEGRVFYGDTPPSVVKAWLTDGLLEASSTVQPYFDGNFPPDGAVTYSWGGLPGYSTSFSQTVTSGDLLVDPDCPPVPDPPKPPAIQIGCIDEPSEWTRYSVLVDNEYVPRWGSAVPIITVETGASAGRQVRIRFYPLVDVSDPYGYQECGYEIEFLLTYLPAHAKMVIDGVTHSADASVGGSDPVSALHLLTGSGGVPYQWGDLVCDRNYVMTVDVAPLSSDMSVSLDVVGRE